MKLDYSSKKVQGDRRSLMPPPAILVLTPVGVLIWLLSGPDMPWLRWVIVGVLVALSLAPVVNRVMANVIERLSAPSPAALRVISLICGVLSSLYLIGTAFLQQRTLLPKMNDECSYVLSTQLLAHGHLWMPPHPLADFFESFFILVKPVYCSIYFPGTALLFAPTIWLHLPTWFEPAIVSGVIVALTCRIIGEVLDGMCAIMAALWLVSLETFRTFSVMIMSHLPMLLLGLLMIWAWLRWRRKANPGWALLIGVFSGWAAITRPADALAYAIPIGVAIVVEIVSQTFQPARSEVQAGKPASQGRLGRSLALPMIAVGAAPFLALQLYFDHGVTGHLLETPYTYSLKLDQPGTEFGFHQFDPSLKPASTLPQKAAYYDWCKTFLQEHRALHTLSRLVVPQNDQGDLNDPYLLIAARATVPSKLLLVLLPLGFLSLCDQRRLVIASTLLCFFAIYLFNSFFLEHYCLAFVTSVILLVLGGYHVLADWSRRAAVPVAMLIIAVSFTGLWEIKQLYPDPRLPTDGLAEGSAIAEFNRQIPSLVSKPAVVLLRTGPDFFQEPVYNVDAPWPDDCPIIRAHDLGPRDVEIIRYYAARQPQRSFYVCDYYNLKIGLLGTAANLASRLDRGENINSILAPANATMGRQ